MSTDIFYPLRLLHGHIHQKIANHRKNQHFYQSILASDNKKVLLLGTPTHSNIGDSAIVLAEHIFLEKCGISPSDIVEITFEDFCRMKYSLNKILKKCSIICWHGGGNMGTLWPHEEALRQRGLRKLPRSFPSFLFPQTIFFDDSQSGQCEKARSIPIYNGRSGLTIAAREQISYETMRELYPDTNIVLSPDIVLSCSADVFGVSKQQRQGMLLCLRADKERALSKEDRVILENLVNKAKVPWQYTDMCTDHPITPESRDNVVRQKMTEFASAKLVVTDRLHGMVFAALTGTPCIVLPNNNHKVLSTYKWIQHLPYICFAHSEIDLSLIHKMLNLPENNYSSFSLLAYFDQIKDIILLKIKQSYP